MLNSRIAEKEKEYVSVCKLKEISQEMSKKLELLAQRLETLNDGSEAVSTVLDNWPFIFESIQLASQHTGALVRTPLSADEKQP
ncbi:DASH complex subunit Dad2 [Schizosaccharomyces cryophilus OY26]|uniref:DASH complex subunit DAD2 n=1 Tax=Schizosaccharomyces cryophilus (strain OY26 / ATCC MYA-4695 / CBS 11777 / NBRC 106824 / NRRL Y48691) TaxID=653667 RepID=S9X7V3_SCHCR|nr:DASH complex subunit Dad2 [Schizosaccharomyces cryophilus OY26]EPY53217.1 DASH complex subunit Dad2 [Schizosaccharomyces cryophilus OY26]